MFSWLWVVGHPWHPFKLMYAKAVEVIIMTAWPLDLHVTAINYTNDALKTSHMMKDS